MHLVTSSVKTAINVQYLVRRRSDLYVVRILNFLPFYNGGCFVGSFSRLQSNSLTDSLDINLDSLDIFVFN